MFIHASCPEYYSRLDYAIHNNSIPYTAYHTIPSHARWPDRAIPNMQMRLLTVIQYALHIRMHVA